jgi:hypothetical protein
LHPFLGWRRAICPDAPFTRETLARFRGADPTLYMPMAYRAGVGAAP